MRAGVDSEDTESKKDLSLRHGIPCRFTFHRAVVRGTRALRRRSCHGGRSHSAGRRVGGARGRRRGACDREDRARHPAREGRGGGGRRHGAIRERIADADAFPQPPCRTLRAGHQLGRFARRGALHTRRAAFRRRSRRGRADGVARHGGGRVGRVGVDPLGHRGREPQDPRHYGHTDPRHDVLFGRGRRGADSSVPEPRGGAQVVRDMDHGVAGRRDGGAAGAAAAGGRARPGAVGGGHQAAQPAAARRAVRPHDGPRRAPRAAAALSLHDPARGHRDGFLRPDRLRGARRAPRGAHALPRCRPPRADACVGAGRRGRAARLRHRIETADAAREYDHGPLGHSGRGVGRRTQQIHRLA